eukprot:58469-Prymnesium_polylepis.2
MATRSTVEQQAWEDFTRGATEAAQRWQVELTGGILHCVRTDCRRSSQHHTLVGGRGPLFRVNRKLFPIAYRLSRPVTTTADKTRRTSVADALCDAEAWP